MSSVNSSARRLARRYLPARIRRAWPGTPRRAPEPAGGSAPARRAGRGGPEPQERLLRALERGRSVDAAVVAEVRALNAAGAHHRAESLAESLRRHEATRTLGQLAGGIVAYRRGFPELARARFAEVPRAMWVRFAAAEYIRSGLAVAREETLQEIRGLVDDDPPEVAAKSWFEVLAPVFGLGMGQLSRELFTIFDRHVGEDSPLWRGAERNRDWMRPWVAADPDSPPAPAPEGGRRTFAIMDYGHPGLKRGSANIGDHVQSIAALGHLVRHSNVRLHGPDELVDVLGQLRDRTRPERRRDAVDADLEVRTVHRDASMYQPIAEDTWVLCFGWYMHALFSMRHGFPLHRNLRPIFVSFHCNKRDLLTPAAVEYLRRYGPVGCRDWTTVYLLRSLDVPAFFSGCLTTTIDTVFGELDEAPPADAPIAYVDVPEDEVPADGVSFRHSSDAVRRRPFTANVREAVDLLETYRRRHRAVVTSRLHCYLPLRAIGVDVEFRPKNPSDIRFDGLLGISDDAFETMRAGLLDKLEQVLTLIVAGRPEAEVYERWREITAEDVAAAERQSRQPAQLGAAGRGVEADIRGAVSGTVMHPRRGADVPANGRIDCAVILAEDGKRSLPVLGASLLEHASRPVHLWILAPDGAEDVQAQLAGDVPELSFTWVTTGRIDPGPAAAGEAARGDLTRLVLADLLEGVDRVVVLPLPSVVTGDIAELDDLDLGRHAFAAPAKPGTDVSGFGLIHAAAARLHRRTDLAAELRRTAHARHRFDFDAFTHDVLVADLERMREQRFSAEALTLVRRYGLTDLEALHYLAGPARTTIPERWAIVPTRTALRDRGLLHWADPVKPWQAELTPERQRWRRFAAARD